MLVISRQSNEFWTACNTGEVAVWKMTCVEDLQKVGQSSIHHSRVLSINFVQQFKKCFTLSFEGNICSWDVTVSYLSCYK